MNIDRRTWLGGLATAGLWGGARPASGFRTGREAGPPGRLPDRFPPAGLAGREGARMSRMLDRVLGQPDKPELVVFGGDNVMAVYEDEKPITVASAQAQFDNWAAEGDGPAQLPVLERDRQS